MAERNQRSCVYELADQLTDTDDKITPIVTLTDPIDKHDKSQNFEVQTLNTDQPGALLQFLNAQNPDALLWFGEVPPTDAVKTFKQSGRPAHLINALVRPEEVTLGPWRPLAKRGVHKWFDTIFAVDQASQTALLRGGHPPASVLVTGRLNATDPPPGFSEPDLETLRQQIGTRPCWLAIGCSPGELRHALDAHRQLSRKWHRLLLIVANGNLAALNETKTVLQDAGMKVADRDLDEDIAEETQIYFASDTEEAGLWYRLASVTFLGGTFDPVKGPSPVHAATLGSAIIHGLRTNHYQAQFAPLQRASATYPLAMPNALVDAVDKLLSPDEAAMLALRAWDEISRRSVILDRIVDLVRASLKPFPSNVATED